MAKQPKVTGSNGLVEGAPRLQIAEGLFVTFVLVAALKEQDLNAQIMQARHFDRLTENIRLRGQLESLPYCHQPNGEGPISIISGHHRARAARAAGLEQIPVILDTTPMDRSSIIAKQIAHNELHGESDEAILRQLVSMITNVDDMLMSGLDEDFLPSYEPDDTQLLIPHADFDWRMVTLMFLPKQLQDFEDAVGVIENKTDLLGVADRAQFAAFSEAVLAFSKVRNVKSMALTIALLTDIARREVEAAVAAQHTDIVDGTDVE